MSEPQLPAALPVPPPVAAHLSGAEPELLVVIVLYNSRQVVEGLLGALPRALLGIGSARVLFVDNASADGCAAHVRSVAPWAEVVEQGENLGYAAGINVGLRSLTSEQAVLILNPDTVPNACFARSLFDALGNDTGIAVPVIRDGTGRLKFSLRREPTLLRALGEALLGGHRAARLSPLGDMIRDPRYYVDGAVADWATGAAMMLSQKVVERVGLWDESFFLYSEETDYALRARDDGFVLRLVGRAEAAHPGGAMEQSPWLWSLVARNRVRLYRKRHGAMLSHLYWSVVVMNELARAARPTHRAALKALIAERPAVSDRLRWASNGVQWSSRPRS